jgi:hypothetical protein
MVPAAIAAVVDTKKKTMAPPEPPMVVRYLGNQQEKYAGKLAVAIYGIDLMSGKQMKWWVPPADAKAKTYAPKPEIMDIVDTLKEGSYVKMEMHSQYNENWVNNIAFYKMVDGEEIPGNFVFYETYEKKDDGPHVQIVTLQKFGQAVDVILPMKADKSGPVVDPDMLATVNAIKKGDVVSADVINGNPPVLKFIDPYKPPVQAKIGKVVEAEVADNMKGPAIQLDEDGTAVTLPILGHVAGKKWMVDQMLLSRVKSIRAGTLVLVTTHGQEGKTFLREITLAPPQPAAESTGKTGTGKFDK